MKFSDNILREKLEIVHVVRTEKEMRERDEYNSHLWGVERFDFPKKGSYLYSTPVRDVKIGEKIYEKNGRYVAYRSE